MLKRIFALALCVLMLIPSLCACSRNGDDQGPYITMYLTDEIYDFDPAKAYYNSGATAVVSLLFDTLFALDEGGNVKNALVKDYYITEDAAKGEYAMMITLNDTKWSTGVPLTSDDVLFAWNRLLSPHNNFEAASLLFDIKNARAIKEGDGRIDNLGAEAVGQKVLKVTFEGPIDYEQFKRNLTSLATAPLPESYVKKDDDWAKKASSIATSGAFKIGRTNYVNVEGQTAKDDYALDAKGNPTGGEENYQVKVLNYFYLERNTYYYRNAEKDALNSSVAPYRILVDCTMSDEDIMKEYKNGHIFYVGDIPYSVRKSDAEFLKQNAKVTDALSTFVCSLNENALISNKNGEAVKLFADKDVRQALSLVIDRKAIAEAVVFAEAATGLVPTGVFETGAGTSFRTENTAILKTSANKSAAEKLLKDKNITPSDYSFSVKVAAYDDTNIAITEMIAAAWRDLGFNVTVEKITTIQNNDILKAIKDEVNNKSSDICDDLFVEAILRAKYEVIAFDYNAFSVDAYSVLANFATAFSGMANDLNTTVLTPHRTGYQNDAYNTLMEAIYYVPYFASLDRDTGYTFLGDTFYTKEEFQKLYDKVKAVYEKYNITPSTNSGDWTWQKAVLLHEAEKLLLADMPVIPVLFNKNAVLQSSELSGVWSTYYAPAIFQHTTLNNYDNYSYIVKSKDAAGNETEEKHYIFAFFPEIDWSKAGKVVEE